MKMLYTANGRYIRCCTEEGTRPVIIVCEKEYEVDVQEFMLWSILNWRILREEEIGSYYEKMASNSNVIIHRSWQDCVQRLLVRGLIVAGTGDTESFPPCDFWWKLSEDGSTQRKPKSCGILRILASVFRFYLNPQGFPSSSHFCPEL